MTPKRPLWFSILVTVLIFAALAMFVHRLTVGH